MSVSFVKLSPSENTTIIITDPKVKKEKYAEIAKTAMAYTHLYGEQVGFITPKIYSESKGRMEMSGGEFCGNGLLAHGAYLAWMNDMEKETFSVEFSGVTKMLTCEVQKLGPLVYRVKGEMPVEEYQILKKEVRVGEEIINGDLVVMKGITHFLFHRSEKGSPDSIYPILLKSLGKKGNNQAYGALGYKKEGEMIHLSPWVYVPGIESLREERSCGSGSLALGLLRAIERDESIRIKVEQPGGRISVEIDYDPKSKKVTSASIETEVRITCEGILLL